MNTSCTHSPRMLPPSPRPLHMPIKVSTHPPHRCADVNHTTVLTKGEGYTLLYLILEDSHAISLRHACGDSRSAQTSALCALLLEKVSLCFSDIVFPLSRLPISSSFAAASQASSAVITSASRSAWAQQDRTAVMLFVFAIGKRGEGGGGGGKNYIFVEKLTNQ